MTQSVTSREMLNDSVNKPIIRSSLSNDITLERGHLLGIMRPHWLKTVESEERLRWIRQMIRMKLMVNDIEAFAHSTAEKLRSEESKFREEERDILMKLMILKRNDERRNLRLLKREQERIRRWILDVFGKRNYYDICVKRVRQETAKRRSHLREKYKRKLEHLAERRKREKKRVYT